MLSAFLALPLPLIVLISVSIPVMVVIPIVRVVSNKHITTDGDAGFEGLVALFGFVGTAFALLLAFIIVNVQSQQASAQNTLFSETSTLETVLKETKTFDPKLAPEIRQLVLGYLEEMRQHEVDATAAIGGDPRAEAAFSALLARFAQLEKDVTGDEAQVVFGDHGRLRCSRSPHRRCDGTTAGTPSLGQMGAVTRSRRCGGIGDVVGVLHRVRHLHQRG
jgi:hypothetical protein